MYPAPSQPQKYILLHTTFLSLLANRQTAWKETIDADSKVHHPILDSGKVEEYFGLTHIGLYEDQERNKCKKVELQKSN